MPRSRRRYYNEIAARIRLRLDARSEEHTSELQSQSNLVCRLLLEKIKSVSASWTQHRFVLHVGPPTSFSENRGIVFSCSAQHFECRHFSARRPRHSRRLSRLRYQR